MNLFFYIMNFILHTPFINFGDVTQNTERSVTYLFWSGIFLKGWFCVSIFQLLGEDRFLKNHISFCTKKIWKIPLFFLINLVGISSLGKPSLSISFLISSVFKNANKNFCVEQMLDLIFTIPGWFSNVLIAFSTVLFYVRKFQGALNRVLLQYFHSN